MQLTGEKNMLVTEDQVADNFSEQELLLFRNMQPFNLCIDPVK